MPRTGTESGVTTSNSVRQQEHGNETLRAVGISPGSILPPQTGHFATPDSSIGDRLLYLGTVNHISRNLFINELPEASTALKFIQDFDKAPKAELWLVIDM
jgi:hypothetical protein